MKKSWLLLHRCYLPYYSLKRNTKENFPFYSVISMGAVIQTLWLVTTEIGMGMQFISTQGEIPENWKSVSDLLKVPDSYELMAVSEWVIQIRKLKTYY